MYVKDAPLNSVPIAVISVEPSFNIPLVGNTLMVYVKVSSDVSGSVADKVITGLVVVSSLVVID